LQIALVDRGALPTYREAIENLAGNPALIGIRSRGRFTRPFELVQQIRLGADARYRESAELLQQRLDETERQLAELQRNFYGFDPSYHVARYHFVHKTPASWTPRHLAIHRDLGWSVPR